MSSTKMATKPEKFSSNLLRVRCSEYFYTKRSTIEHEALSIEGESCLLSIGSTNWQLVEGISQIQARSNLKPEILLKISLMSGKAYLTSTSNALSPRVSRHKRNLVLPPLSSFLGAATSGEFHSHSTGAKPIVPVSNQLLMRSST